MSCQKSTENFVFLEKMGSKCKIWLKRINAIMASSTSGLINIPYCNTAIYTTFGSCCL